MPAVARSHSVFGVAVLASLGLLASGCGGSKSPSVANIGTTTSSSTTTGGVPSASGDLRPGALAYSECMRSSGVPNFPDPSAGGGFSFGAGSGIDPSSPAFKAAQTKCLKLLPGGGPPAPGTTTHPTPRWLAQMAKVARCMRRNGAPAFPDPATKVTPLPAGGGVISDIEGVIFEFPTTLDMQSPEFLRAAGVCKFPLHNH